jgi:6-phosphogluconolactonase
METRWHVAQNDADWLVQALTCIDGAEAEALAIRGVFHIVLAGGSTPKRLYQALVGQGHDWTRWQVWYGDERCLPVGDADRNSTMAALAWLERVGFPRQNIHPMPAELGAQAAAEAYAREVKDIAQFDLVLLGLGEDGHTASLFPGHDWGEGRAAPAALAVFDAPKPPPERVSLSAWRLGTARKVLFLVQGAGKREAVAAWRQGRGIPAAAIQGANGVDVLLDRPAYGEES